MLFGSELLRPATWYPQPALHTAAPIITVTIRRLMAPISPPASPHSTPAIEYYPPLPKTTNSPAGRGQPRAAQAQSPSLPLPSGCRRSRLSPLTRIPPRHTPISLVRVSRTYPAPRLPRTYSRKTPAHAAPGSPVEFQNRTCTQEPPRESWFHSRK